MKTFAIAAAALGLAVTATPAMAGSKDVPVEKISTEGLDLDTPAGQKMLDRRIDRAARSVCNANQARTGTRLKNVQARACVAKARASAKRQVTAMIEDERLGG
ncbi:UrcA family protein [Erythrobacter crassostreae]|uniref:UrcA family protein n=1 Tax=Erythrobacter crassostreae TaxID=2828328 RepID=A0A9X1F1H3_9SPHN|nr:UrcA family protein [Erythrobacter crassostrea]MBV7258597.1 UrcA family protein [Erythrobacter crassostrea]